MNKKFATLLFAIGLGASASSALAFSPWEPYPCEYYCREDYDNCLANGGDANQCLWDQRECRDRCGI